MKRFLLFTFLLANVLLVLPQEQLTNLPTVYIDTNGAPVLNKKDYVNGTITVVSNDSEDEITNVVMGIRGRGNSTWGMAKKPYRVKFDKKINFLQQNAKLKNWVFLANYADKTLMRNALAFEISNFIGMEFTPGVRFIDVVLNGEYLGNYMVTDQVEVNKGRVPVVEQEPEDTQEPEITGGYLLEIDGFASGEPEWFYTSKGIPVTIKYPKDDEINPQQRKYITDYTRNFEDLLFSDNFTHETEGYRPKVDEASVINWYIACELTGNSDSFWSTYIYKKRSIDKLYFGPVWDFDIAFNNDDRLGDATQKLMRQSAHVFRDWIKRLWQDPWFRHAVNARWKELVAGGIEQHMIDYISDTSQLLQSSQDKNFQTWANTLNVKVYREYKVFGTYNEGVDYLKEYIKARISFLTESFEKEDNNEEIKPFVAEDFYYYFMNDRVKKMIDIENQSTTVNSKIVIYDPTDDHLSQDWEIQSVNTNEFMIIGRVSGLALQGNGLGQNLILATPNTSERKQLWRIEITDQAGVYGIINVSSGRVIDNNGGSSNNGNAVIEWYNELGSNLNQEWSIEKNEAVISSINPEFELPKIRGYFAGNVLYLEPSDNEKINSVGIYTVNGQMVDKKILNNDQLDVSHLNDGIYIIQLFGEKHIHSLKLKK